MWYSLDHYHQLRFPFCPQIIWSFQPYQHFPTLQCPLHRLYYNLRLSIFHEHKVLPRQAYFSYRQYFLVFLKIPHSRTVQPVHNWSIQILSSFFLHIPGNSNDPQHPENPIHSNPPYPDSEEKKEQEASQQYGIPVHHSITFHANRTGDDVRPKDSNHHNWHDSKGKYVYQADTHTSRYLPHQYNQKQSR